MIQLGSYQYVNTNKKKNKHLWWYNTGTHLTIVVFYFILQTILKKKSFSNIPHFTSNLFWTKAKIIQNFQPKINLMHCLIFAYLFGAEGSPAFIVVWLFQRPVWFPFTDLMVYFFVWLFQSHAFIFLFFIRSTLLRIVKFKHGNYKAHLQFYFYTPFHYFCIFCPKLPLFKHLISILYFSIE